MSPAYVPASLITPLSSAVSCYFPALLCWSTSVSLVSVPVRLFKSLVSVPAFLVISWWFGRSKKLSTELHTSLSPCEWMGKVFLGPVASRDAEIVILGHYVNFTSTVGALPGGLVMPGWSYDVIPIGQLGFWNVWKPEKTGCLNNGIAPISLHSSLTILLHSGKRATG